MTRQEEILARREAVLPKGVGRLSTVVADSARGALITDVSGNRFLDFASGIGVMSAGHCQPEVVDAICAQAKKLQHTCIHVATYEPYIALCEKLVSLFPHGERTKAFLVNSGAEAVENAVKIARQATGRPAILCYTEAFHGRTLLGLSLTSKAGYKKNCGPFAPEVFRLPFPNYYHSHDGLSLERFVERELGRFRQALVSLVPAEHVAAVLIEVVQGEGGFNPCPPAYLQGLRRLCDEFGILLIIDEVQSGFCRTGRWAAYEHTGVIPDLSTWAKSMGGGMPISAVLGKAEIMDKAAPGTLGGTYGGNPVACASALATIALMERLNLAARAEAIGSQIRERLEALQRKCPLVGDVRGMGAMMAMELVLDGDPSKPATALVAEIVKRCVERGLLIITAGSYANVIRLLPPLVITDEELGEGLSILEEEVLRAASVAF